MNVKETTVTPDPILTGEIFATISQLGSVHNTQPSFNTS
ncbi:hypothetical protein MNBD_CHLOROFLEXI01-3894 [hydrothermal vent metagenome]|uniref:Uncharacterized protein n=1 Tax=hydrothermal vent metagenome TaxID=652676 RepID=A0A3B0VJZ9_9ZZZZ